MEQLSFWTVVSYRATPVAVLLIGMSGCYMQGAVDDNGPPWSFIRRLFEGIRSRPTSHIRALNRAREQLGDGPVQMSRPKPITFVGEAEGVLDNLAHLHL